MLFYWQTLNDDKPIAQTPFNSDETFTYVTYNANIILWFFCTFSRHFEVNLVTLRKRKITESEQSE